VKALVATTAGVEQAVHTRPWIADGRRFCLGSPDAVPARSVQSRRRNRHAQGRAQHSHRPITQDVFGYVTEFTNNPKWRQNAIDTWWIDEGPTRPGRRGGQAARILGRRMDWLALLLARPGQLRMI